MRYSLRAPVEGYLIFDYPTTSLAAVRDGIEVALVGERGFVSHAVATIQVPPEKTDEFRSSVRIGPDSVPHFTIGSDRELHTRLLRALQELELDLAFACPALKRIRWREIEQHYIAETADEQAHMAMLSLATSQRYPEVPVKVPQEAFASILEHASHTKPLLVVKGFWLEGRNDFDAHRYVQAFHNFYFVLEWLYANGKFKERAVEAEFGKAHRLLHALEETVSMLRDDDRRQREVRREVPGARAVDGPTLRRYLVRMRGRLHHVSRTSPGLHPTINQDAYEVPAYLAFLVATNAISNEEEAIRPRPFSLTPVR